MELISLIEKYNRPVPRYTSYPTVPDWNTESFTQEDYLNALKLGYDSYSEKGLSIYIHLPYCESLCTYCGCNTRISVNHAVEEPYIDALLKEWQMYVRLLGDKPIIKEIHLGGGTPTFFSPHNLRRLILGILEDSDLSEEYEFSFEGHPNNTSYEHLETLYECGFSRVSFGIQDLSEKVQKAINRVQPLGNVKRVTEWAREIGYKSVNYDLIYGLPFQTIEGIEKNMDTVVGLKPDRLAYYSYAHVPWVKPGQRAYSEKDLPTPLEKVYLNQTGQEILISNGYVPIGMDHFALPNDMLTKALQNETLNRNFMGYTTSTSKLSIGLGVSSISDVHFAYGQNHKTVENYLADINRSEFPIIKGHIVSPEESKTRDNVQFISCKQYIPFSLLDNLETAQKESLFDMVNEGLLEHRTDRLKVTQKGSQFLRNICSIFDPFQLKKEEVKRFSQSV